VESSYVHCGLEISSLRTFTALGRGLFPEQQPCCALLQGFPEADIQSLKEAVQLSRQEAVEALRHTRGDVQKAFLNELASLHLNVALVDDLVLAYAAQR
jgi:hypothetical protein